MARESQDRTASERKKVEEKRAARKVQAPPRKFNSVDVRKWFIRGIHGLRGSNWVVGRWTVKERKLAMNLLDDYGPDLVEKAVAHFCENWNDHVRRSRGRLAGDPTVNLLWAMREQVFPAVQLTGKVSSSPKDSDEYNPDTDDGSGIGW